MAAAFQRATSIGLSASAAEFGAGVEPASADIPVAAHRRLAGAAGRSMPDLLDVARRARRGSVARSFEPGAQPRRACPGVVARMRRGADDCHCLGLLQRRLCHRQDGEAQSRHPDRGAWRPAILRLPGPPHLQFLRRVPARRFAAICDVACGVRRSQPMRAPHGACARGAAVRAPSLFRRDGSRV